jgi:hypothetical protein
MANVVERDWLRTVNLRPYRAGCGPVFKLMTWDTGRQIGFKSRIGYTLSMKEAGRGQSWVVLFTGEDFGCSPLHAVDSDETCRSVMSFLTLRPGDTDREYFAGYTPEQLAFCSAHAEALACEVSRRFGGE